MAYTTERASAEEPLILDSDTDEFNLSSTHPVKERRWLVQRATPFTMWLVLPWVLFIALSSYLVFTSQIRDRNCRHSIPILYSPIQDEVAYTIQQFQLGFNGDFSEYQGMPSPEIETRWSQLYEMGITTISQSQAAKLPNKTAILPHDLERRYVMELDVFHQLHCLHMIRRKLFSEYDYEQNLKDSPNTLDFEHLDHCVDSIRQSLMCTADISVIPFQWIEEKKQLAARATIPHVCRDFQQIQEWAKKRAVHELDMNSREMNDPLDPDTWLPGFSG